MATDSTSNTSNRLNGNRSNNNNNIKGVVMTKAQLIIIRAIENQRKKLDEPMTKLQREILNKNIKHMRETVLTLGYSPPERKLSDIL